MAYHSFPQMMPTDDAQKSSVSWLSTHVSMGVLEEQKRRTNQIALEVCTWRTKEKNQSKRTSRVLAKDPPMVKLVIEESPRTQECKS